MDDGEPRGAAEYVLAYNPANKTQSYDTMCVGGTGRRREPEPNRCERKARTRTLHYTGQRWATLGSELYGGANAYSEATRDCYATVFPLPMCNSFRGQSLGAGEICISRPDGTASGLDIPWPRSLGSWLDGAIKRGIRTSLICPMKMPNISAFDTLGDGPALWYSAFPRRPHARLPGPPQGTAKAVRTHARTRSLYALPSSVCGSPPSRRSSTSYTVSPNTLRYDMVHPTKTPRRCAETTMQCRPAALRSL